MQIRKTISITKVLFLLLLLAVLTSQSVRAEFDGEGWDAHSRQLEANLEDGTPNFESSLDRLFSGGGGSPSPNPGNPCPKNRRPKCPGSLGATCVKIGNNISEWHCMRATDKVLELHIWPTITIHKLKLICEGDPPLCRLEFGSKKCEIKKVGGDRWEIKCEDLSTVPGLNCDRVGLAYEFRGDTFCLIITCRKNINERGRRGYEETETKICLNYKEVKDWERFFRELPGYPPPATPTAPVLDQTGGW